LDVFLSLIAYLVEAVGQMASLPDGSKLRASKNTWPELTRNLSIEEDSMLEIGGWLLTLLSLGGMLAQHNRINATNISCLKHE
jgi:hypothetical protein